MSAKDIIRGTLALSDRIVQKYIEDLSDDDLKVIPIEGMHPIAWQIGHLLVSEHQLVEAIRAGSSPELPEGFADAHGRTTPGETGTEKFLTKEEYRDLFAKQRAATTKLLDELDDAQLDEPAPESLRKFIPSVGGAFNFFGTHVLMHVGQWVAVRRKLGKPVAI